MAHYFVAGGAGFIGAAVSTRLLAAGHRVTGFDNLNTAYDVRMKAWRLEHLRTQPGFSFIQGDITDRPALEAAWQAGAPFDALFNLAARAGVRPSVEDPWLYMETNTVGALNLLELCKNHGVQKIVMASSSSVYGDSPTPYHEDLPPTRPLSPYAASKVAAEALAYTYHHLHQLDITVFRYFTVYGPAGRPDMAPFRFVQWISEGRPLYLNGDGHYRRDFTYIDDIARGTIAGLKRVGYRVFNLGSDHPVDLLEIIRLLEGQIGRAAQITYRPAHPADSMVTWADITRARAELDWQPETPYTEGFAQLVAWYRANRAWAQDLQTGI